MTLSVMVLNLLYICMGSLVTTLIIMIYYCFREVLTEPAEHQESENTETESTNQTRLMTLNEEMTPF